MILETICVPLLSDSADSNETSSSMVLKKKNKKDSFDDMFFFIQTFSLKLKQHTLKQILNTKFYGIYLSFVETSD